MEIKVLLSVIGSSVAVILAVVILIRNTSLQRRIRNEFIRSQRLMHRGIIDDPDYDYIRSPETIESRHQYILSMEERNRRIHGRKRLSQIEQENEEKSIYEKRKDSFLNIANISFHFADKERIRTFYNDYFKEPTIKDLIRETVAETNSELKGSIPAIIESKLGGKELSKWISTIKLPDITESGMFKRYQKETILNNQVKLGLEEDDIELSVLSDFEAQAEKLKKEFDYKCDPKKLSEHRTLLKEKAAERTLKNLEKASDMVLIEGNFLLEKENDDFYKVSMLHPVSNYLASGKEVRLSCLLQISQIEPSVAGNYSSSIGKHIPLKIYGQVWQPVNRESEDWELRITPLAVY